MPSCKAFALVTIPLRRSALTHCCYEEHDEELLSTILNDKRKEIQLAGLDDGKSNQKEDRPSWSVSS